MPVVLIGGSFVSSDPYDVAPFSVILHLAGYRAVSEEKNHYGDCCTELEVESRNRL
jgi:hypothetical protein